MRIAPDCRWREPLEVAAQLGHKDARLVFQRYGHLYPGSTREAASALNRHLKAIAS